MRHERCLKRMGMVKRFYICVRTLRVLFVTHMCRHFRLAGFIWRWRSERRCHINDSNGGWLARGQMEDWRLWILLSVHPHSVGSPFSKECSFSSPPSLLQLVALSACICCDLYKLDSNICAGKLLQKQIPPLVGRFLPKVNRFREGRGQKSSLGCNSVKRQDPNCSQLRALP